MPKRVPVRWTDAPKRWNDPPVDRVRARFQSTAALVGPTNVHVYVVVNVIADADADVKREDVVVRRTDAPYLRRSWKIASDLAFLTL
jgi:hypothetical protein